MRLVRLYIRVLGLLKPHAALAWTLAVANLALAAAQFAEPVLFGKVIDALSKPGGADLPRLATLLLAWLVAALLRLAQGSGSVAAITAATLLAPVMGDLSVAPVLVALAAAAGASFGGHVSDNTFWMFKALLGLSTKGAFKVYTMAQSIMSIVALGLVVGASLIA